MAKTDMQDIARMLSNKHKLSIKDAESFLTAFFETLNEGLNEDKLVKVKSLGTFKVIDVKERESVDVNTGERIKIESRSKITFTPDSVMKDLVNKPFAHFETVILNEGVDFSDLDVTESEQNEELPEIDVEEDAVPAEDTHEEISVEDTAEEALVEETIEEAIPVEDKHETEDNQELVVAEVVDEADDTNEVEETETDEETDDIDDETDEVADTDNNDDYNKKEQGGNSKYILLVSLLIIIVSIGMFFLGYFVGQTSMIMPISNEVVEDKVGTVVAVVNKDSVENVNKDSVDAIRSKADSIIKASEKDENEKNELNEKKTEEKPVVKEQEKAVDTSDPLLSTALKMVKTGAYTIEGTATTVTVRKGQTLKSISKAHLGEGMECYVQVHNGILEAKEGDKLNIPKLKIKRIKH